MRAPGWDYSLGTELTKDDGETGAAVSAGGPSVDHVIAEAIGDGTPFRSLELGTNTRSTTTSYSGVESPNPMDQNPSEAFMRIFAGIEDSTPMGPDPAVVRRRRILDSVAGQLNEIKGGLSTEARDKMEAHLGAIESIEQRLDDLEVRGATCTAPTLGNSGSYLDKGVVQGQIAAAALACDLTRVVTLMYGTYGGVKAAVPELGIAADEYHQMGHDNRRSADAHEKMTRANETYAAHLHDFAANLDAIPEGDGTVLDNTLILWCTSMNDGSHRWDDMPYVLLGGKNMGLEGGRYLRYSGVNHNQLLVSCCQLMGLSEVNRFGNPEYGTGPLPQL